MAKLILEVPDGSTCDNCEYRVRNTEAAYESYHCTIFRTRADSGKSKQCKNNTRQSILYEK